SSRDRKDLGWRPCADRIYHRAIDQALALPVKWVKGARPPQRMKEDDNRAEGNGLSRRKRGTTQACDSCACELAVPRPLGGQAVLYGRSGWRSPDVANQLCGDRPGRDQNRSGHGRLLVHLTADGISAHRVLRHGGRDAAVAALACALP